MYNIHSSFIHKIEFFTKINSVDRIKVKSNNAKPWNFHSNTCFTFILTFIMMIIDDRRKNPTYKLKIVLIINSAASFDIFLFNKNDKTPFEIMLVLYRSNIFRFMNIKSLKYSSHQASTKNVCIKIVVFRNSSYT